MGAKGKKRREKNYRAAHGGYTGLPPPPDPSKLDSLPSKLRQIITFTHSQQQQQQNSDLDKKRKRDDGHAPNGKGEVRTADFKQGDTSKQLKASQYTDDANDKKNKKKKKRKRKEVEDLRFAMEVDKTNSQLKRKERKKKYLESKKKKNKKTTDEDNLDFPRHEKIKFGDVVQAPPKLAFIPKALKNTQDASQERLRLRAIEEYRSRKGWSSRPGIHLPPPVVSDP
ncbi:hypothetical protein Lal_00033432 [Lupinus albus]|uniref:Uncharacterized protein n=1 Tax=Lupinus albus TaxID=3870 RepID=A0A6A4QWE3_LUPAL|nr:hypothetical protein Lalb_Chr03g0039091 [Lupinus albus]KAF1896044.1 hypothetical protein Lal_00033432 [Lupinus albus]